MLGSAVHPSKLWSLIGAEMGDCGCPGWQAIDHFLHKPRAERFSKIYQLYLAPDAPQLVNVPSKMFDAAGVSRLSGSGPSWYHGPTLNYSTCR
jgi:hypothetical protein